jgi:hypothetical protein
VSIAFLLWRYGSINADVDRYVAIAIRQYGNEIECIGCCDDVFASFDDSFFLAAI